MTWGGIKKGDPVIEVYDSGSRDTLRRTHARSVGAKWIVTEWGNRYDATTGHGEYGWTVHTEATLEERDRRNTALRRMFAGHWHSVSTDRLVRIVAILDEEAPR